MNKVLVNCNPSVLGFIGSGIVGLLPFLNSRLLFSRFEHVELWMVYLWMGGLFFVAMVISRYRRSRLRDIIISVSLGLPTALIIRNLIDLMRYPGTNFYLFTIISSLLIALPAAVVGARVGSIIEARRDKPIH